MICVLSPPLTMCECNKHELQGSSIFGLRGVPGWQVVFQLPILAALVVYDLKDSQTASQTMNLLRTLKSTHISYLNCCYVNVT